MDELMYGCMDRTDGSRDGWIEGWFVGWMVVGINGCVVSISDTITAWARLD
jgi:hypothetical protein